MHSIKKFSLLWLIAINVFLAPFFAHSLPGNRSRSKTQCQQIFPQQSQLDSYLDKLKNLNRRLDSGILATPGDIKLLEDYLTEVPTIEPVTIVVIRKISQQSSQFREFIILLKRWRLRLLYTYHENIGQSINISKAVATYFLAAGKDDLIFENPRLFFQSFFEEIRFNESGHPRKHFGPRGLERANLYYRRLLELQSEDLERFANTLGKTFIELLSGPELDLAKLHQFLEDSMQKIKALIETGVDFSQIDPVERLRIDMMRNIEPLLRAMKSPFEQETVADLLWINGRLFNHSAIDAYLSTSHLLGETNFSSRFHIFAYRLLLILSQRGATGQRFGKRVIHNYTWPEKLPNAIERATQLLKSL